MDGVKEFLESSTIHGLVYIASGRRLLRLLWLCVVISGFTGAVVIIYQSFSSWAVSPVSTTIETLPITELDFPSVTVCPPRNSFTSLNPDLVKVRNVTLDGEKKRELIKLVDDSVNQENYTEIVTFYQELFDKFSTETVLRTLARILYMANKLRLTKQFNTAKTLLDNLAGSLNLQYLDLALLTTSASVLQPYKELREHQLSSGENTELD